MLYYTTSFIGILRTFKYHGANTHEKQLIWRTKQTALTKVIHLPRYKLDLMHVVFYNLL